jgi:hypothetical protein
MCFLSISGSPGCLCKVMFFVTRLALWWLCGARLGLSYTVLGPPSKQNEPPRQTPEQCPTFARSNLSKHKAQIKI